MIQSVSTLSQSSLNNISQHKTKLFSQWIWQEDREYEQVMPTLNTRGYKSQKLLHLNQLRINMEPMISKMELTINDMNRITSLDYKLETNLSICYEAFFDNLPVFIKKDKIKQEEQRENFLNELLIQTYVHQALPENTVKIIAWIDFDVEHKLAGSFIMEKGVTDLHDLINNNELKIKEKQSLINQVTLVGIQLRQLHVVHQDLKPGQLIYFSDGKLKLTDFGSAVYEGTSSEQYNSKEFDLRKVWRPYTPAYQSYQTFLLINYENVYKNQEKIKSTQSGKTFYFYYAYRVDSFAIGLIIFQILKKLTTTQIKILAAQKCKYKLSLNELNYLNISQQKLRQIQIQCPITSQSNITWKLVYGQDEYTYPLERVYELINHDFLERRTISQVFLNTYSVKYDYAVHMKYLYFVMIVDSNYYDYSLKKVYETLNNYLLSELFPPDKTRMVFNTELEIPSGFEDFGIIPKRNHLQCVYNSLRALGVDEFEGSRFTFQRFVNFLRDKEIIDRVIGTYHRQLQYYLDKEFQIKAFVIDNFYRTFQEIDHKSVAQLLVRFLEQRTILVTKIKVGDDYQNYFIESIDVDSKVLHGFCGKVSDFRVEIKIDEISSLRIYYRCQ